VTSRSEIPVASVKISVLLKPEEAARFDAYCEEKGYKKSTLVARLIRDHLDQEKYAMQRAMFENRGG